MNDLRIMGDIYVYKKNPVFDQRLIDRVARSYICLLCDIIWITYSIHANIVEEAYAILFTAYLVIFLMGTNKWLVVTGDILKTAALRGKYWYCDSKPTGQVYVATCPAAIAWSPIGIMYHIAKSLQLIESSGARRCNDLTLRQVNQSATRIPLVDLAGWWPLTKPNHPSALGDFFASRHLCCAITDASFSWWCHDIGSGPMWGDFTKTSTVSVNCSFYWPWLISCRSTARLSYKPYPPDCISAYMYFSTTSTASWQPVNDWKTNGFCIYNLRVKVPYTNKIFCGDRHVVEQPGILMHG